MTAAPFLMWGYQPHFHAIASERAQELFLKLDGRLQPRVILMGIRLDDMAGIPAVSVYPEGTGYAPEIFDAAEAGALMLRQMHRERPLHLTDNQPARRAPRLAQIGVMKNAIRDAVAVHSDPVQVLTYVGRPRLVDNYLVAVLLKLHRPAYDALPHLERAVIEDIYAVPVSLVQTTAEKFIDVCIDLLSTHSLEAMGGQWPDVDEILRTAGIRFMATAEAAGRNSQGLYTIFRAANAISSQMYEGEVKRGSLLIARRGHDHVDVRITLPHPVPLDNHRAARKLLQMCSDTLCLLADSAYVYGLGSVRPTYDPADESVFEVRFTKHFTWQFCHHDTPLMEVAYGEPSFPRPLFDAALFCATLARVVPGITAPVVGRLCERAKEASEQKHGTMLVVTPRAASEAQRLRNESTLIAPVALDEATLKPVTETDGAVLLDDQGVCHAVGVILDGRASPHGTPARRPVQLRYPLRGWPRLSLRRGHRLRGRHRGSVSADGRAVVCKSLRRSWGNPPGSTALLGSPKEYPMTACPSDPILLCGLDIGAGQWVCAEFVVEQRWESPNSGELREEVARARHTDRERLIPDSSATGARRRGKLEDTRGSR